LSHATQKWIVACSTIVCRRTRKSIVSRTRTSSYLSIFLFVQPSILWWLFVSRHLSDYHLIQALGISTACYYFFSFFSIFFHFPSSIIKQRRQFCSVHARVQSARSLFFPFVTRTGIPTRPHFSLCFPPFYCCSRAHFLPRD
jgi:hypothetical protein